MPMFRLEYNLHLQKPFIFVFIQRKQLKLWNKSLQFKVTFKLRYFHSHISFFLSLINSRLTLNSEASSVTWQREVESINTRSKSKHLNIFLCALWGRFIVLLHLHVKISSSEQKMPFQTVLLLFYHHFMGLQ